MVGWFILPEARADSGLWSVPQENLQQRTKQLGEQGGDSTISRRVDVLVKLTAHGAEGGGGSLSASTHLHCQLTSVRIIPQGVVLDKRSIGDGCSLLWDPIRPSSPARPALPRPDHARAIAYPPPAPRDRGSLSIERPIHGEICHWLQATSKNSGVSEA